MKVPTLISSRPDMPEYGLLDEQSGAGLLPFKWIEDKLMKARNYWLVTASSSGWPHAAPVWGLWHERSFYFATGQTSRKARNIETNPAVVMHLESGDDVAIIEGQAALFEDKSTLTSLDKDYYEKYGVHLLGNPTYRIHPKKAFGWIEEDFPGTATRWVFVGE